LPTRNAVIITRPTECPLCDQGYLGMQPLVDVAMKLGLDVTDCGDEMANEETVEQALEYVDPMLFIGFGHGLPNVFTGQYLFPILMECENDQLMEGRVVYLLSCYCAEDLGISMNQKGAIVFVGYEDPWTWVSETGTGDPYIDRYARGFWEAGVGLGMALVHGYTVQDAVQFCIAKHKYWYDYWSRSSDDWAAECMKWHLWDMESLRTWGDITASGANLSTEQIAFPTGLAVPEITPGVIVLTGVSLGVGGLLSMAPKSLKYKALAFALGTGMTFLGLSWIGSNLSKS